MSRSTRKYYKPHSPETKAKISASVRAHSERIHLPLTLVQQALADLHDAVVAVDDAAIPQHALLLILSATEKLTRATTCGR
jgi:hypothetical protein